MTVQQYHMSVLLRNAHSLFDVWLLPTSSIHRELDSNSQFCLEMSGRTTTLYHNSFTLGRKGEGPLPRNSAKQFHFERSYWSVSASDHHYTEQEKVYSDLGVPVMEAVFAGYNSCVLAYGQTGSGKTYTMTGSGAEPGLIPRICEVGSPLAHNMHHMLWWL